MSVQRMFFSQIGRNYVKNGSENDEQCPGVSFPEKVEFYIPLFSITMCLKLTLSESK